MKTPTPIFLFCLPRSGSTLLQRVLSAHEDITTVSESHLLLPYLYSLKKRGVYSEYNHQFTARGIQNFCLELPNGENDYLAEIRDLALRLYAKATKNEVKYFLDKAGAYHLVIEEIINLFQDAKFVMLWRNPLSIIASLMHSWSSGKWNLYLTQHHLFLGLPQLIKTYQKYQNKMCAVQYEQLIATPDEELRPVFEYLEIPFLPNTASLFNTVVLKGNTGDQIGMKKYKTLSQEPIDKWKLILGNPMRKLWCKRYLEYLGKDRLAVMGYDMNQLMTDLHDLPLSTKFLGSDCFRIPYGVAYRFFEGGILKQKIQAWRDGQPTYLHK